MTEKIHVIGATGLLGSSTVNLLSGTRSIVELRRPGSIGSTFATESRILDFLDSSSVADAICDAETILFFPAFSTPSAHPRDVRRELQNSAMALANLIEGAASVSRLPHIIFPSTGGAIYGSSKMACSEETPASPESSYAFGKLISEEMLRFYARIGKVRFTALRFANLYGSAHKRMAPQGVIDRFLDDAVADKVSSVWVDPSSTRDYLFVDDAARAVKAVLERPQDGVNAIYNVGSGRSISMGEILSIIAEVTKGRHQYRFDRSQYAGVDHISIDTSAFRSAYPGWADLTAPERGIATTWERKLVLQDRRA
ncbi:NAD-dependent epimerase/dehydratase family protein [Bradyrhizobium sp. SZCCHNRI3037]|uniref:NAD-dependent epimerase/dehydratase family protein n=1 Tax=Bradyrhizobium sp. SZCCHNRI3037 TaxID=3057290 RepID=UPI002916016A|nr:NAD-dependent epimerase/dehydratase family protein [Bradyrhizobium sp. SZCCHNRI3037]